MSIVAPCLAHPLGTDNFGRDVLSRVMNGSGMTFFVAVCTVLMGAVIGTVIGALTGYFGGWIDEIIMRINDILLSFPSVLLALLFISFLGARDGECDPRSGDFIYPKLRPHCPKRDDPVQGTGFCKKRQSHGGWTLSYHVCPYFSKYTGQHAYVGGYRL